MSAREHDERIQARLEEARRWFREHHAGVEPGPDFAARVAALLRRDPAEDLGRAALRLLPAALALLLVLAWAAARVAPSVSQASSAAAEVDVISWVYGETEAAR
jgi:hypothetical protein